MSAAENRFDDLKARALDADIVAVAHRLGADRLRRQGPDYIGACPLGCARDDGFVLTPAKGIFLCRPSKATGDVVELVRHVQACSFPEALEWITGDETREPRQAPSPAIVQLNERRERAEREKQARAESAVKDIIAAAVEIEGTQAHAYLAARGLKPAARLLRDLRFVPNLPYWGYASAAAEARLELIATLPAMLALIRDAAGSVVGIHQTYLDPVAPKKWKPLGDVKRNQDKKMRKTAATIAGAMIRLGRVSETLAVGEGIETTLSWFALGGGDDNVSLAAGLNRGNLKALVVPEGVERVILLIDGDDANARQNAIDAAERLIGAGIAVDLSPAPHGKDFNDVLMASRE